MRLADLPDSYRHPAKAYRFPIGFLPVGVTAQHTNLNPLVSGPTIQLSTRHAKIRRDGDRR